MIATIGVSLVVFVIAFTVIRIRILTGDCAIKDFEIEVLQETIRSAHGGIDRLERAMAQSITRHYGDASRTECCRRKLHNHFIDELRRYANVAGCIEKKLSEAVRAEDDQQEK